MNKYLFLILIFVSNYCYGQDTMKARGSINNRGYFQFVDYKTQLEFLDVTRKDHIDGDSYFYFTFINKKNGKKSNVVINTNSDFARNKIKEFSTLTNGFAANDLDYELANSIVNDSIYNRINKLSEDDFFSKYVYETKEVSSLEIIGDREIEKAVLLRLLKNRISIGVSEVGGDLVLAKHSIKW